MDAKEIVARLEIVKLAISINDHSTIILQTKHLIRVNSSRLNEISALLNGKNYRQALYLIKSYLNEMGDTDTFDRFEFEGEGERVLDIEDMLRMSPLAKETIKDYKRSIYTKDDLEAFSKKIVISPTNGYDSIHKPKYNDNVADFNNKDEAQELKTESKKSEENKIQEPKVEIIKKESALVESIEEEFKEPVEIKKEEPKEPTQEEIQKSKELAKALEKADNETPLDEISSEVLGSKTTKSSRAKVLSKYKALREKFAKKTLKAKNNKKKDESDSLNKAENITLSSDKMAESKEEIEDKANLKNIDKVDTESTTKLSKEKQIAQEKIDRDTIYSPIPHIEEKFRQSFVLYPPLKDSEVWVEEVIRFLKYIAKNSFTERDVKQLLDEYNFYLEKRDIAKASQVLLLAASTESKYAKFLLARELFSGRVIKRDLKKSFELMKELANSFYAEAVCDLGQFYEYGIGVSKDKKVALRLYEKAFELGSSRATKHINRLKESNSIFSAIFRFK